MRSETCSTSTPASCSHGRHDRFDVVGARGIDRDVAHLLAVLDPNEVDRVEAATRVADRASNVREPARPVLDMDSKGGAEGG